MPDHGRGTRIRAGIAGLGQVGLLFDDDPLRSGIWTHFAAFETVESFDLVAVADPDSARVARALERRPGLRGYPSLEAMMSAEQLDVVSLCTPTHLHPGQILEAAGSVRAIICEKPLGSGDLDQCRRSVDACAASGTILAVNYHRRVAGVMRQAVQLTQGGALGTVHHATVTYAGPLDAMGSHAVDTVQCLVGALHLEHVVRGDGDRYDALLQSGHGVNVVVHATGPREDFVFEVDLFGSEGRLQVLDDAARLRMHRFEPSLRYGGYRELVEVPTPPAQALERFLPLFEEVAAALRGDRVSPSSDGWSALQTQATLEAIRNA